MNTYLYLPVVFSAILILLYTWFIRRRAKDQIWPWVHSLLAAIISVSLGLSIGFIIFFQQEAIKNQMSKDRYIKLLGLELIDVKAKLETDKLITMHTVKGSHKALVTFIQPLILEEAGKSGLFREEDSFIMLNLATSIRMFEKKTDLLMNLLSSAKEPIGLAENVDAAIENIKKAKGGILRGIGVLSINLKININRRVTEY